MCEKGTYESVFVGPSVLQEAAAVGYEVAGKKGFWGQAIEEMAGKLKSFCEEWDELGLPVSNLENRYRLARVAIETC